MAAGSQQHQRQEQTIKQTACLPSLEEPTGRGELSPRSEAARRRSRAQGTGRCRGSDGHPAHDRSGFHDLGREWLKVGCHHYVVSCSRSLILCLALSSQIGVGPGRLFRPAKGGRKVSVKGSECGHKLLDIARCQVADGRWGGGWYNQVRHGRPPGVDVVVRLGGYHAGHVASCEEGCAHVLSRQDNVANIARCRRREECSRPALPNFAL